MTGAAGLRSTTSRGSASKMAGPSATNSAMLDKERRQMDKIKRKQQKDIEQMMEYEMKLQYVQEKNEEKIKLQRLAEERKQQEAIEHIKEQEEFRRQKELQKSEKMK